MRVELSDGLKAMKEVYQRHGYLLAPKNKSKTAEFEFWKWAFLGVFHWSSQGSWESMLSSGSVTVNFFTIQRHLMVTPDQNLLRGWKVCIGPLLLNWSIMRKDLT